MRGVRLFGSRQVEVRDYPDPVPEGDEVVVRLEAAAICGSDLHGLYEKPGEKDFIPGHEGAGVVVAGGATCVAGATPSIAATAGEPMALG